MSFVSTDNPLVSGTHRLRVLLRSLGWAFDSITLIVALLDFISTYWVCARLAGECEWLWFGLVLGGVVVGNLACAAFAVSNDEEFVCKFFSKCRGVCRFFIIVAIAQLLPFLRYACVRLGQSKEERAANKYYDRPMDRSRVHDFDEIKRESLAKQQAAEGCAFVPEIGRSLDTFSSDNDFDVDASASASSSAFRRRGWLSNVHPKTGAGKEAIAEVSESFIVMETLEAAIKDHKNSHTYLYVAAAVWSAPQVVIQLLALFFIEHGHKQTARKDESCLIEIQTLLAISISLSLISLVLKGYAIVNSPSISNILWKFFCFSADVFGAVYVFATISERSSPQQYSPSHTAPLFFLSEFPTVTWIVQLFAVKWALFCATFALTSASFFVYTIRNEPADLHTLRQIVLCVAIGVIFFLPSVVALEGFCLSFFALLLSSFEGKYTDQTAFLYIYLGEWGDPRWLRRARAELKKMCRWWNCLSFSVKGAQTLGVQQQDYEAPQLPSHCCDTNGQSDLLKKTKDLLKQSARELHAFYEKALRKEEAEEISRDSAVLDYFCGTTSEEEEDNSEEEFETTGLPERDWQKGEREDRHDIVASRDDNQSTREGSERKPIIILSMVPVPAANIIAFGGKTFTAPFSYVFGTLNGKEAHQPCSTRTSSPPRIGNMSEAKHKRFALREDVRRRLVDSLSLGVHSEKERRLRLHMLAIVTSPIYVIPAGTDIEVYKGLRKGEIRLVKQTLNSKIGLLSSEGERRGGTAKIHVAEEDDEDAYIGDSEGDDCVRLRGLDPESGFFARKRRCDNEEFGGLQKPDGGGNRGVQGGVSWDQKQQARTRKSRRRGGVTQWPHRMPFREELLKAIISPKEAFVAVSVSPQEMARVSDKSRANRSWIAFLRERFTRESPLYSISSLLRPPQRTHAASGSFSVVDADPPVYFRIESLYSAVPDMFVNDVSLRYHWIIASVISWVNEVGYGEHFLFRVGLVLIPAVFAVGQFYSLLLPFANVALDLTCAGAVGVEEGADENLLQKISFVAYAISIITILLLTPFLVRFVFFMRWLKPILSIFGTLGGTFTVPRLFEHIEDRHTPTSEALVREVLGAHVKFLSPPLPKAISWPSGETRCDTAHPKNVEQDEGNIIFSDVNRGEKKRLVDTRRRGRKGCGNLLPPDLADVVASYMQPREFDLRNESRADMQRIRELGRL